jgi:hypothetical protein
VNCIGDNLKNKIKQFSFLYGNAQLLREKLNIKGKIILVPDSFFDEILINNLFTKNIKISIYSKILNNFNLLKKICMNLKKFFLKHIEKNFFEFIHSPKKLSSFKAISNSKKINFNDFRVLYFPHKNIYYGNFYIKNWYYQKSKIFFKAQNILHLFLYETDKLTKKYFGINKISFRKLYDFNPIFKETRFEKVKELAVIIRYFFEFLVKGKSLLLYFEILATYKKIKRDIAVIKNFSNAKLALIYYDYLFPKTLSLALSLSNLKTFAVQERGLYTYLPEKYFLNFDYYCVWGKDMIKSIKRSHCKIGKYFVTGNPRVDYVVNDKVFYKKYCEIRKKYFLLMALDWHSSENSYLNVSNLKFYKILIKLAELIPELYIVIKGKNYDFIKLKMFKKIVEKIELLPNIEVETKLKKYQPDKLLNNVDGILSCYTSLAEQALSAGIPTYFYNTYNYPPKDKDPFYEYGISLQTDEETLKKIKLLVKEKKYISSTKFNKLRNNFFNSYNNGNVIKNIHKLCNDLI